MTTCILLTNHDSVTLFSKSSGHKGKGLFPYSEFYSIDLCVYHYTRLHCLDYCCFIVNLKFGTMNSPTLCLFSRFL